MEGITLSMAVEVSSSKETQKQELNVKELGQAINLYFYTHEGLPLTLYGTYKDYVSDHFPLMMMEAAQLVTYWWRASYSHAILKYDKAAVLCGSSDIINPKHHMCKTVATAAYLFSTSADVLLVCEGGS